MVDGWADGVLAVTQKNKFSLGETVELLLPGQPSQTFVVSAM